MARKYNSRYYLFAVEPERNTYLILHDMYKEGSYLYRQKSYLEYNALSWICDALVSENVQCVITNSPETFGEYEPYTVVDDLWEFLKIAEQY